MGPLAAGAGNRSLHIDFVMLAADGENHTGIVLRNLTGKDTVRIGGLDGAVSVLGSSAATAVVEMDPTDLTYFLVGILHRDFT